MAVATKKPGHKPGFFHTRSADIGVISMNHWRHFVHVDEAGVEHRFDRPPTDKPFLTVDVLESDGSFVTERTWTRITNVPGVDHTLAPAPRGQGWKWEGRTSSSEHVLDTTEGL